MSAKAVTPSLFVGDWIPHEHVKTTSAEEAVRLIGDGKTVLVPDAETAGAVLFLLGMSYERVEFHLAGV